MNCAGLSRSRMWKLQFTGLLGGIFLCLAAPAGLSGEDKSPAADKERQEQRSKRRLEFMKSAVKELKASLQDDPAAGPLKIAPTPLLRYNDETRGFLDAGVWRLGEQGRPRALVTVELYRAGEGQVTLSYEFLSLTSSQLSLTSARGVRWSPRGTELKMAALPDTPAPADSSKARLLQMRQLARRFAAHEEHQKDKVECRLMPQPIDRYDDPSQQITDGAIFAFANGTNPEIGLLLECGPAGWSYGVVRLSAAATVLDLDGKPVFQAPESYAYNPAAPYTGAKFNVPLLPEDR